MLAETRHKSQPSHRVLSIDTRLEAWRCILLTPTQITTVVEKMEKKHPDAKVTIVDWPNLLQLKNQFLNP